MTDNGRKWCFILILLGVVASIDANSPPWLGSWVAEPDAFGWIKYVRLWKEGDSFYWKATEPVSGNLTIQFKVGEESVFTMDGREMKFKFVEASNEDAVEGIRLTGPWTGTGQDQLNRQVTYNVTGDRLTMVDSYPTSVQTKILKRLRS